LWLRNPAHEVQSSGKPIFLFHCPVCEREFARASVDSNWRAVRVGPFRIEFLSDSVNEQWLSEVCARKPVEAVPEILEQEQAEALPVIRRHIRSTKKLPRIAPLPPPRRGGR
jgi:hypothetical protein